MPLDTRIALGAQPLQLENQLAQYGQAVGIQNAMQQNQLGQMQMSAAQRTMQEEEGAKSFLSTNPDLNNVENQRRLLAFGKTGLAYGKAFLDQRKASQDSDKTAAEILGLNQKNFTAFNPPIRAAAGGIPGITAYVEAMYKDPVLGALAARVKTKEQALKENIEMYTKDPDQWVTAHSNLEGAQMLDALKMNAEKVAERNRIASLPPLPSAVPTGTVNDARAPLAAPGAAPSFVTGVDSFGKIGYAIDGAKVSKEQFDAAKNAYEAGVQVQPVRSFGQAEPVNNMAPNAAAAANNVNAMVAPTGNEATLQAMAAERKKLTDRLNVLDRMPFSKGVEREIKDKEARLKELNAQVNLRPDGSAITPYGVLTAAAAPSDILRLQREEADLRAKGDIAGANVIANRVKKLNELTDNRTASQKEQAVLDDPNSTAAQKKTAAGQIAKLNNIPEKAMSAFESGLAASNLSDAQKSALRNKWLETNSERAPAISVSMPVAVENPDRPGSVIYVNRDEAIGKTPAAAIEGLAPKEIQAREAKYPQALQAVKTLDTKTESLAKDIEVLANHPGLTGISGLIYGRTPAVTKDARAAQALYDSIVARGGFAELQNMRAASPTGGALGNVSNQEGQYLRDAWAAINRTQDTEDLKANLLKAAAQARASKASIKEAFDATYDYRANRGGATAPAAAVPSGRGVDTTNPLLK